MRTCFLVYFCDESIVILLGKEFTDHMLEIDWDTTNGWHPPRISPTHNISLHPAASVFHYASEVSFTQKGILFIDIF